ncbi:hypothetical protein Acr_00g0077370 [Actinidia rufa]|uniref:Uncharacterized protein n=1 Tax=Actinidia rufa TaxID=165716 RepID=A0A7J0DTE2_9ERIC|nr:hypothetical protein Acr_00g0077370 [Actinidia rufa]
MLDAKGCRFDASGGILRVSKGNKEMLWGKKTGGLYRLEGNVQTGGATVQHGSSGISKENGQRKQPLHRGTQSKRRGTWRIWSGTRAQGDALGYVQKSGQTRVVQPVQDVHREAQRKETKSILRSCTAKGAATPKRVSFALDLISGGVLSSCAHKGGEMEPPGCSLQFHVMWAARGSSHSDDESAILKPFLPCAEIKLSQQRDQDDEDSEDTDEWEEAHIEEDLLGEAMDSVSFEHK